MTSVSTRLSSSFRDPSGFLFSEDGVLYRAVNRIYQQHYDYLIASGLYDRLIADGFLIPHQEIDPSAIKHVSGSNEQIYKIIRPERVSFISYPYEWCFNQLKDTALTTLKIQKLALDHGMILKDASAYNIQFHQGRPLLIDTLSFEIYEENKPWVAYRQFCQHFLAPLSLMAWRDIRLSQLLRIYIDGLPLDLASKLLPGTTWLKPALLTHIHLHTRTQKQFAKTGAAPSEAGLTDKARIQKISSSLSGHRVSKQALLGIVESLEASIDNLRWKPAGTEWGDYYEDTNYSPEALEDKKKIVCRYLDEIKPKTLWDMGANTGLFSRLAAARGIPTISFDIDPAAVEKNYQETVSEKSLSSAAEKNAVSNCPLLPLCLDLTNPSPAIGWANAERLSLIERGPAEMALALALIHHLAISNNTPLSDIAAFFSRICRFLVIEFVPKNDSQVQRLLRSREDVFPDYGQDHFESAFGENFSLLKLERIADTRRIIYLMRNRNTNN